MPKTRIRALVLTAAVLAFTLGLATSSAVHSDDDDIRAETVTAEIVATGIPGAGAIAQVGLFHVGGPFRENATLSPFTAPGQVLDRTRLLVASSSNFGAPLKRSDEFPGSILSIDLSGGPVAVPASFASDGGQVSALGGRLKLFTANSPGFENSVFNPSAATRDELAVSLPLGISFNNAFGRPWFANAPFADRPYGTITVIDPGGQPFKGPPDPVAGGVFAGDDTNRSASSTHGIIAPALATSLITKSPDGTGRAVFFAALADGSVVQVHVQKGVDGMAPPGSFTPISGISPAAAESTAASEITRVGMVFNWVPTRIVYVTDPLADRILALDIADDGTLFTASARYLTSPWLDRPVDIAPTSVEVAARNFASNTTLGGGSDLYVLNRGNNTVVRMTQGGKVVAARRVQAAVPQLRLAGLAVSDDGRTLWLTATTPRAQGVVLQIAAFGSGAVSSSLLKDAAGTTGAVAQGEFLFSHELTVQQKLGPLFNGRSCTGCHENGGPGADAGSFVTRFGRIDGTVFDPLLGEGGPVARQHSITEVSNRDCELPTGVPPDANVTSRRSAMTLRGTSLIDNILDREILRVQETEPPEVRGHPNVLADGRLGHFGWKAHAATLVEFMAEAQRDELGLTSPLLPRDLVDGCGANKVSPEADGVPLTSLVAFLNTIDPPVPTAACLASTGASRFAAVGCASCHTPAMSGPGSPTSAQKAVRLYSDLLLHDMGPGLADHFPQGQANGSEFRTMPLWRVSDRPHFLHDGRAGTLLDAIRAHGGQAASAAAAFDALSAADKQALLDFLGCI